MVPSMAAASQSQLGRTRPGNQEGGTPDRTGMAVRRMRVPWHTPASHSRHTRLPIRAHVTVPPSTRHQALLPRPSTRAAVHWEPCALVDTHPLTHPTSQPCTHARHVRMCMHIYVYIHAHICMYARDMPVGMSQTAMRPPLANYACSSVGRGPRSHVPLSAVADQHITPSPHADLGESAAHPA